MTSGHSPLPCAYRSSERHDEHLRVAAERPLRAAGEALNLAVLCLEDADEEEGPAARQRRAAAGARLPGRGQPGARAGAGVPAGDPRVQRAGDHGDRSGAGGGARAAASDRHAAALVQPRAAADARAGEPLRPEDEAQLAVLVRGLARTARIDRVLRHAWIGVAVGGRGAGADARDHGGGPADDRGRDVGGAALQLGRWCGPARRRADDGRVRRLSPRLSRRTAAPGRGSCP
jgi:hypothetical protein